MTLASLNESGRLSSPIDVADAVIPGDDTVSAALGYLHSNCGPCHGNALAPSGLLFWVDVETATPEETGTYLTGVGMRAVRPIGEATERIIPGDPDMSLVVQRMESRMDGIQMPPIGTEIVHPEGIEDVRAWITALPVE